MASQAGVWIDHKQAFIVTVAEGGGTLTKLTANVEEPAEPTNGGKVRRDRTPSAFQAADKIERKTAGQHRAFYGEVLAALGAVDSLLILGPGPAKEEFLQRVEATKLKKGGTVELANAEKMTDRQLVAQVVSHFSSTPAKPAAAPKKKKKTQPKPPVVKKVVTKTAGKPATKTVVKKTARKAAKAAKPAGKPAAKRSSR